MRWGRFIWSTGLLALLMVGEARAECQGAYTGSQLGEDIGRMTTSLRILDEKTFMEAGTRMEARIICVRSSLPPRLYASAYRFIGTTQFFKGDEEAARSWFRSALELEPEFYWDAGDLDIGHPLRLAFDDERSAAAADPVAVEGKVLKEIAGAYLTLDGRRLDKAEATVDRPHFLQVVSESDKTVRSVLIIQGNAIPDQFLEDAPVAVVADEGKKKGKKKKEKEKDGEQVGFEDSGQEPEGAGDGTEDMFATFVVKRVRPKAKTPLMLAGGVVSLAGVGIYGASFVTHSQFESATTTEDLEGARDLTNMLVVASGATLAVGLGVGYVGIMMDGSPGLRFGGRF